MKLHVQAGPCPFRLQSKTIGSENVELTSLHLPPMKEIEMNRIPLYPNRTKSKHGRNYIRVTITATRVGVKGSAHTFCVVSKRTSPHAYVWAKQLALTCLFFSLRSLSHAYIWTKCITPTRPLSATYLMVPHAQRDSHHVSPQLPWSGPSSMFVYLQLPCR